MTADKPFVLIVDDQSRNLDALEAMLTPLDCTPVRAQSADAALLSIVRTDFAAIVLDIRMPDMSGIELAQVIKQRRRSQHVPILFLTAHMLEEQDVLQGYGVGAVDYLSKPVNPEILRSKVSVFIDLFRKTRELARLNQALRVEIGERQRAQEALKTVNLELEHRVEERTAALTRAHREARENGERLRMALAVARLAAWEWHLPSGRMRWSSDPEAAFGFPKGAFGEEQRMVRALHPDDKTAVDEALETALSTGWYASQHRLIKPDGQVVWITEQGHIVRDGDRPGETMLGISRDVTSEKEAALERERLLTDARLARDEAERQSRLKDEFLATLSHELRTPMNVVLGWLATLDSGKPIRDVYSALTVIRRNAELQARLIEDLLDMNRLMSGNVQLEIGRVDIGGILQTTIQGLKPAADGRGVQLLASIGSAMPQIDGDAKRLQQVLWNLVHNAIKFTPAGGRVDIHIHPGTETVHIIVQDNGRGIDARFLPYVFERFRKEDTSMSGRAEGLGLGLSIARHLVELHVGRIEARSAGPGKGTTIAVQLPAGNRLDAAKPVTGGDGNVAASA
jgi:PAS domain S-box-containing protein